MGAPVALHVDLMTLEPVLSLERVAWAPESEVIGIYIGFSGNLAGHCLICLDETSASALAAFLLGGDEDAPYEMAESALMEAGNIIVSWLVNAIADAGGWKILVSPPSLAYDMLGSLVNTILASALSTSEELMAVCVRFSADELNMTGTLYFLPDADTLRALIAAGGGAGDAAI